MTLRKTKEGSLKERDRLTENRAGGWFSPTGRAHTPEVPPEPLLLGSWFRYSAAEFDVALDGICTYLPSHIRAAGRCASMLKHGVEKLRVVYGFAIAGAAFVGSSLVPGLA